MKKFLTHIFLLAVTIAAIAIGCDFALDFLFTNYNVTNKVSVHDQRKLQKGEIYLCGSSRVWHNLIPNIISDSTKHKAINLGFDDFGPIEVYYQLSYLFDLGFKPKLVVLQLDESYLDKKPSLIGSQEFLPLYHKSKILNGYFAQSDDNSFLAIPLYRYIKYRDLSWRGLIKKPFYYFDKTVRTGYKPYPVGRFNKSHDKREVYSTEPEKENIYVSLLHELCKQNNCALIFFTSPIYNLEKNTTLIDYLKQKHCPFIDQSNLIEEKKYFIDFNHVNNQGAIIQSTDLAMKIKDIVKFE